MSDCTECGGEVNNKNSAGHYRDHCRECIEELAADVDRDRRDPDTFLREERENLPPEVREKYDGVGK